MELTLEGIESFAPYLRLLLLHGAATPLISCVTSSLLELYYVSMYTYIVFLLYEKFSAYLLHVHVLYIVAFDPWEYKLLFS